MTPLLFLVPILLGIIGGLYLIHSDRKKREESERLKSKYVSRSFAPIAKYTQVKYTPAKTVNNTDNTQKKSNSYYQNQQSQQNNRTTDDSSYAFPVVDYSSFSSDTNSSDYSSGSDHSSGSDYSSSSYDGGGGDFGGGGGSDSW